MTEDERQWVVAILATTMVLVRLVAHREAGGLLRDQSDGMAREGGTVWSVLVRIVFLGGGLGGLLAWIMAPEWLPGSVELPAVAHYAGVILTQFGIALLVWVHLALGVHFSGTLHLRDDHHLVKQGPYARIRHPMYTSFLLMFVGLTLLTGNLLLGGILLGSQAWVLLWRLPQEERSLAERFGGAWVEYRRATGTLTPWV